MLIPQIIGSIVVTITCVIYLGGIEAQNKCAINDNGDLQDYYKKEEVWKRFDIILGIFIVVGVI